MIVGNVYIAQHILGVLPLVVSESRDQDGVATSDVQIFKQGRIQLLAALVQASGGSHLVARVRQTGRANHMNGQIAVAVGLYQITLSQILDGAIDFFFGTEAQDLGSLHKAGKSFRTSLAKKCTSWRSQCSIPSTWEITQRRCLIERSGTGKHTGIGVGANSPIFNRLIKDGVSVEHIVHTSHSSYIPNTNIFIK